MLNKRDIEGVQSIMVKFNLTTQRLKITVNIPIYTVYVTEFAKTRHNLARAEIHFIA